MEASVNLPEGFELEQAPSSPQPSSSLPPGFEMESAPHQAAPEKSDFEKVKDYLTSNPAFMSSPMGIFQSGLEGAQKLANKAGDKVTEAATQALNQPNASLIPEKARPYIAAGAGTFTAMAPDLLMAASAPPAEAAAEAAESSPNILQKLGAQSLNKSAGIQPRTLARVAAGENPAALGNELGQALNKEGVVGWASTPEKVFQKASALKNQYGNAVGDALSAIKSAGVETQTNASHALKPILDKWAELGDSTLSQNRVMAKPYAEIFSKLEKVSHAKGGALELDDIENEMQEVGKLFTGIHHTSDKYPALAELYGTLAKVRDGIIDDIATRTDNPGLKDALRQANQGYSRYSHFMPDFARNAAREGAGKEAFALEHPIHSMVEKLRPAVSKTVLGIGNLLSTNPAALGKYAPVLMEEAEKGPENLQSFHHALMENDPYYIDLFKRAANQ